MLDWLRLIRASGLITIATNLMATAIVAVYYNGGLNLRWLGSRLFQGNHWTVVWVGVTSACLFASGMLWNDLADVERDRGLHPRRPLPSGRIALSAAFIAGILLSVGALMAASRLEYGFYTAGMILSLALIYNFVTKSVPYLGSLNMAAIRFGNALFALLLLGSEYLRMGVLGILDLVGIGNGPDPGIALPLIYPMVLGLYIFGLTLASELESRKALRLELVLAGLIMAGAVLLAASKLMTAHWIGDLAAGGRFISLAASMLLGLFILGFLCWRVGRPWIIALRTGRQALVKPMVIAGLKAIILLDALIATAYHPVGGLAILSFYPIFWVAGKIIRMD